MIRSWLAVVVATMQRAPSLAADTHDLDFKALNAVSAIEPTVSVALSSPRPRPRSSPAQLVAQSVHFEAPPQNPKHGIASVPSAQSLV